MKETVEQNKPIESHHLELKRRIIIDHHIKQGNTWIKMSDSGKNTAALSYAAFEFRLAIEHIMLFYWIMEQDEESRIKNKGDISEFAKMRNRIRKIRGNNKILWRQRKFTMLILKSLKIDGKFHLPEFGEFDRNYQICSDLCHIEWTVYSTDFDVQEKYYEKIYSVGEFCMKCVSGLFSLLREGENKRFNEIREKYVLEEIGDDEVLEYIKENGLFMVASYTDGRAAEFVGEAVQPKSQS